MNPMGLLRRRKREPHDDGQLVLNFGAVAELDEDPVDGQDDRRAGYSESMADRMRRLDTYSYEFDEEDAEEVEARIRRMFYGAKVEDD